MAEQIVPPAQIYEQESGTQGAILKSLQKKRNLLGWLRLVVVLLTAVAAYLTFSFSTIGGILIIVAGIAAFLYLVATDANNQHDINHTSRLIRINQEELAILQGRYLQRDDGSRFQPDHHNYAADLDVLGKASLYQYLNRCNSEQGQQLLAANLLQPISAADILARQEALQEMSPKLAWRQQLQARSLANNISFRTQQAIERWLGTPQIHFTKKIWRYFVPAYSAVTITIGILAIVGIISFTLFTFFFILLFTFSTLLSKKAMKDYT